MSQSPKDVGVLFPERFYQRCVFGDIRFGNIRPTDIDGTMDIGNRIYIFEVKHKNAPLTLGQKIHFEKLHASTNKDYRRITIVATHDTPIGFDVEVDKAIVTKYLDTDLGEQWNIPFYTMTVWELVQNIERNTHYD